MKLTNYNYGYNNYFNCSIHGKIIVNNTEWQNIKKYLLNPFVKYDYKCLLKQDLQNNLLVKNGNYYCIRVTATQKVVNRFKIKGYKAGNYVFFVKKD